MGLLHFFARLFLILVNLVFFLAALALIVLGLILKFGSEVIKGTLESSLNVLKNSVQDVFSQATPMDTSQLNMAEVFNTLAILAIVLGCVFLGFCFFGLFGACYKNKCMLIVYVSLVGVIFLAQVTLLILIYAREDLMKEPVKDTLMKTLDEYQGTNGTDAISLVWSVIMIELKCCGLTDYSDFQNHAKWWGVNEHVTPMACCNPLPTTAAERDTCAGASSSTSVTTLQNSNYNKGCMNELWNLILYNTGVIIGIVACELLQFLVIVFGIIMIVKDGKEKVHPDTSDTYPREQRRQGRNSDW